jgi:hypothetical protein
MHVLSDANGLPLVVGVSAGNTHDSEALADKAYSSRAIREHLRKRGIRAVIPVPADQRSHRLRRGGRGGRPPAFDREAGARTFGCLLHLYGDADGARFWWQFAAGAGDDAAEYCLFLDHSQCGEFHDAEHWGRQLALHRFTPDELLGDRTAAPVLTEDLPNCVADYIVERHHPDLGVIPFPKTLLIRHARDLTTIQTKPPCAT